MDWDAQVVTVSGPHVPATEGSADSPQVVVQQFQQFVRTFQDARHDFIYRDQLTQHAALKNYSLTVDLTDLRRYGSGELAERLETNPEKYLPLFESGVASAVLLPAPDQPSRYQVILKDDKQSRPVRTLGSADVGKLVLVRGIVLSTSDVKAKATTLTIACRNCMNTKVIPVHWGLGGARFPRQCDGSAQQPGRPGQQKCPLEPFVVLPDRSEYADSQLLKLQELPEEVPTGEMPRHLRCAVERESEAITLQ
ncbi:putative DNA replication licensing factor MCM5 [Paratrimastix pyriformis]|uniref:DNA replication licensing factor MCM5 n=1 Tax=Paratrimastix pyriformis TaxID=342808 RepID=A0ABQ8UED9_9EUKA|nr:putative DNA replication licensing factor MCM5 [Paratrimastix pyriformis]